MDRDSLGSPRLEQLVKLFSRFPGIGRKSATRMALHLLASEPSASEDLSRALLEVKEHVRSCERCGAISEQENCDLCRDPRRVASVLCVVEQPTDIFSLERAAVFRGRYHVLGGLLSPLDGVEPSDLRLHVLRDRVVSEKVEEVVVALAGSVEGEATALYLARLLRDTGTRTSRLATGIPVGGQLDFVDDVTLERAFSGRRPLQD